MTDEEYMKIAIELSSKADFPYGAIVVDSGGGIIGRSDAKIDNKTCYTHAEFVAIQSALKHNNLYGELKGCTIYTSCEPCPMCMGAILYQKFKRLVYGAKLEDSNEVNQSEVLISCETIAKNTKNCDIEINNIMRDEAVAVLEQRQFEEGFEMNDAYKINKK